MLVCSKEGEVMWGHICAFLHGAWSPTMWGPEPWAPGQGAAGSGWAEGRQHRLRSKLRKSHPLPPLHPISPRNG